MFNGYLTIDGIEVLNGARTEEYVRRNLPGIDVLCDSSALGTALGSMGYISPVDDSAPWVLGAQEATQRFYGLFPGDIQGVDDSTREVELTELTGDGAVHSLPRHGAREIRVVAVALAKDEEALEAGLTWLRDVLTGEPCGDSEGFGCTGRTVRMFQTLPETPEDAARLAREFHRVEVIEGPLTTKTFGSKRAAAKRVEFTFSAGTPWAFTLSENAATLNMDNALNHQDPAGQNCSEVDTAYEEFINDPYFTAIEQPPRPPIITPPNLIALTSWRRLTADLPASVTQRWGVVTPTITLDTGDTAIQQIRIRFYRTETGLTHCDYEGEFLVSYLPANAVMTIDGIRHEITVRTAAGVDVPGGHLVYGSAGRPFMWPDLNCRYDYTMVVDMMPDQLGLVAILDTAVRE